MKALKTLFIATALLGSAAGVQAADNFVGLTWGETSNNIQKSKSLNRNLNSPNLDKVIDNTGTWGIRAGQQFEQGRYYATYENISDTSSGNKLRQQNLLGSYDAFLPIGDNNTKLFGGATLGLVKLEQDGKGFKRDSDVGYAAGLQAGILQEAEQECLDRRRLSLPAHQRQHRDDPAWRQQAGLPGPAQQLAILPGRQLQVLNDRAAPARACFDGRAGRSGRISSGGTS